LSFKPALSSSRILIGGGSAGANIPFALDGQPAITVKATPKEPLRAVVDGRVLRLSPRALARLQGVDDLFPLPLSASLSTKILGNGVPPPLLRAVALPLLTPAVLGGVPTSRPIRALSLLSGAGVGEWGLRERVSWIGAVERDAEIAGCYARAHGPHVVVGDVRDQAVAHWAPVDYLHASPVCTNYSRARIGRRERGQDVEIAVAVARAIETLRPIVVTVENVPEYLRETDAIGAITTVLTRAGYHWDARVYDAADYGVPQHRSRLILRAVRWRELPPAPTPQRHRPSWFDAIKDLRLAEDRLARWQIDRLDEAGVELPETVRATAKPAKARNWSKVVFAGDLAPCDCCDEPWCPTHETHFADCACLGPTEDDVDYEERADGLYGRRRARTN
jgi:site-specific DNA-cytosine methylase